MDTIQTTYLSLLRQALALPNEMSPADQISHLSNEEVQALLRLCLTQGTAPLVYNELIKHQSLPFVQEQADRLRGTCAQNMLSYERLLSLLRETWTGLTSAGIHPVVLKGFGLASLYPTPYLRAWGDLDIYVGPAQYHQAAAVLREVFPTAQHHDEEWEELKHYNFVLPNGLIEMHRTSVKLDHPFANRYFLRLEQEAMLPDRLQWVEMEGLRFAIPEARFNILFTFFHAWFHFVEEGLGFKQICDVALLARWTAHQPSSLIHHPSISAYLNTNLRKLKLWQPWQLMGYVLVHALGIAPNEWPLYHEDAWLRRHGERFLQRVLSEGLCRPVDYGDSSNRYEARAKAMKMNVLARKWTTLRSRFREAEQIRPYSPAYARHMMMATLLKGLKRLIRREKMEVMY